MTINISIKTNNLKDEALVSFEKIISRVGYLAEEFVDNIIICDSDDLERSIKELDADISLTSIYGGLVLGKTISVNSKTLIFIITDVAKALVENGAQALKTLFHEFGHAKIIFECGKPQILTQYDNYEAYLNAYWQILRDEFLAEMFCANILVFDSSITWYGEFTDNIEKENFRTYIKEYKQSETGLNWHLAFYLLHQYYFTPLFQKAGFLEGIKKFMSIESIYVCEVIQKILDYQVVSSIRVPLEFNSLVLNKWDEFHIVDLLNNN